MEKREDRKHIKIRDHRPVTPDAPKLSLMEDMMAIGEAVLGLQYTHKIGPPLWGPVKDGLSITGFALQDYRGNYFVYERAMRPFSDGESMGLKRVNYRENGAKSIATQAIRSAEEEYRLDRPS